MNMLARRKRRVWEATSHTFIVQSSCFHSLHSLSNIYKILVFSFCFFHVFFLFTKNSGSRKKDRTTALRIFIASNSSSPSESTLKKEGGGKSPSLMLNHDFLFVLHWLFHLQSSNSYVINFRLVI